MKNKIKIISSIGVISSLVSVSSVVAANPNHKKDNYSKILSNKHSLVGDVTKTRFDNKEYSQNGDYSAINSDKINNKIILKTTSNITFATVDPNFRNVIYYYSDEDGLVQFNQNTNTKTAIKNIHGKTTQGVIFKSKNKTLLAVLSGDELNILDITDKDKIITSPQKEFDNYPIPLVSPSMLDGAKILAVDSKLFIVSNEGIWQVDGDFLQTPEFKQLSDKELNNPFAQIIKSKNTDYIAYGDEKGLKLKSLNSPYNKDILITSDNVSNGFVIPVEQGNIEAGLYFTDVKKGIMLYNFQKEMAKVVMNKKFQNGFGFHSIWNGKKSIILGNKNGLFSYNPLSGYIEKIDKDNMDGGFSFMGGTKNIDENKKSSNIYFSPNKGLKYFSESSKKNFVDYSDLGLPDTISSSVRYHGKEYVFVIKRNKIYLSIDGSILDTEILNLSSKNLSKISEMHVALINDKIKIVLASRAGLNVLEYNVINNKIDSAIINISNERGIDRGFNTVVQKNFNTYLDLIIYESASGIYISNFDGTHKVKINQISSTSDNFGKVVKTNTGIYLYYSSQDKKLRKLNLSTFDVQDSTQKIDTTPIPEFKKYNFTNKITFVDELQDNYVGPNWTLTHYEPTIIFEDITSRKLISQSLTTGNSFVLTDNASKINSIQGISYNGEQKLLYQVDDNTVRISNIKDTKIDLTDKSTIFDENISDLKSLNLYKGNKSILTFSSPEGIRKYNFYSTPIDQRYGGIIKKQPSELTTFKKGNDVFGVFLQINKTGNKLMTYNIETGISHLIENLHDSIETKVVNITVQNKNYIYFNAKVATIGNVLKRYDIAADKVETVYEDAKGSSFLTKGIIKNVEYMFYVDKKNNIIKHNLQTNRKAIIGVINNDPHDWKVKNHAYIYNDIANKKNYLYFVDADKGIKKIDLFNNTVKNITDYNIWGTKISGIKNKGKNYLIFSKSFYTTRPIFDKEQSLQLIDLSNDNITQVAVFPAGDKRIDGANFQALHVKKIKIDGVEKIILVGYWKSFLYNYNDNSFTSILGEKFTEYNTPNIVKINDEYRIYYIEYKNFHKGNIATKRVDFTREHFQIPVF